MALMGTYDAGGYVSGQPSSYPQLPAGIVYYQPGMWWSVTGAGTIEGVAAVPGDRLYAIGRGRNYGDFTFGELIYGDPPDYDWPPELVSWLVWDSTAPPSNLVPFPFSGCPYTTTQQPWGNWAPGWRIVIDAFYNADLGSRTYGTELFGDELYGDTDSAGRGAWHDITRPAYEIRAIDGTRDGRATVDVSTTVIRLLDTEGVWFDMAPPTSYYQPPVGAPIRVGFLDPQQRYHPVHVGIIERITDEHDTAPRVVEVQAFGRGFELVSDALGWQRGAEPLAARFDALLGAAHWRWGLGSLVYPNNPVLLADRVPRDVVVREELDRCAQSSGLFLDTDRWGDLRLRWWPHEPLEPALEVVDCDGHGSAAVVSPMLRYIDDEAELLNVAVITNDADPVTEVRGESAMSIGRYGRRTRALGFPRTGLAFSDTQLARDYTARVVARFSHLTKRIDQVVADTAVDTDWLPALAELDTGDAVHVERTAIRPMLLDGVVVGWEHQIVPGRWTSSIYTSTTTPSF